MSDSASKTKILGLPVFPSDTSQLASGSILTYDLANRQFKFIPGGGVAGVSSLNGLTGALTLVAGTNISLAIGASTITISATGGGTGTVTSVGLTAPSEFSVSGSPVTTSGTLAITWTSPATVPHGGTGLATLPIHQLFVGNGTSPVVTVATGSAGDVLTSNGAGADPTFQPSAGSISFADEEVPSGSTPGTSFTLANAPSPAASLLLFWNGVLQKPGGVDYTLAGTAITTVNTIGTGDSFLAWYRF